MSAIMSCCFRSNAVQYEEDDVDEVNFYEAGLLHRNDKSGRGLKVEPEPLTYGPIDLEAPSSSEYSDYSYDYSD